MLLPVYEDVTACSKVDIRSSFLCITQEDSPFVRERYAAISFSNFSVAIVPSLNQPIRSYPLRPLNEPAIFVIGPRQGQKVYPNGNAPAPLPGPDRGMPPIGFGDQQAMLAQRNNAMEALERRNRAERERSSSMAGVSFNRTEYRHFR